MMNQYSRPILELSCSLSHGHSWLTPLCAVDPFCNVAWNLNFVLLENVTSSSVFWPFIHTQKIILGHCKLNFLKASMWSNYRPLGPCVYSIQLTIQSRENCWKLSTMFFVFSWTQRHFLKKCLCGRNFFKKKAEEYSF